MTRLISYDHQFNINEWFVMAGICIGLCMMLILPRRFSSKRSILYFMCGPSFGAFFDLTLGVIPVSFYDVGDTSAYEFFDFLSVVMYGPYSYLFFYLYHALKLKFKFIPIYVLCWALLSVCFEWFGTRVGEFHYNHGYSLQISFVAYLIIHCLWLLLYHTVSGNILLVRHGTRDMRDTH